jgi:TatD DNase family protein
MPLFDTHAHLDDPQIVDQLEIWLNQARQADLVGITAIGTSLNSSRQVWQIAQQHPDVYAAVGIHPNYCHQALLSDWGHIVELIDQPKVVALGETGLDRYWDYCPIELQREWFTRHLELSAATGKPLVIHVRDSEADVLEMLGQFAARGPLHGIWHSFAGSLEGAEKCLEWGLHISFSGTVTYKKAEQIREVAKRIPDDRILIETDAPYLSPHPHRGQRPNHPALVRFTAACLAELRQQSFSDFSELTTRNAQALFGIPLLQNPEIEVG